MLAASRLIVPSQDKLVILVYSNVNQRKAILPGCNVITVYFRCVIGFQNKSKYGNICFVEFYLLVTF